MNYTNKVKWPCRDVADRSGKWPAKAACLAMVMASALAVLFPAWSIQRDLSEGLLLRLFPGATIDTLQHWFGIERKVKILSPIGLRNRRGVVNVSDAKVITVGSKFVYLAFEIFLAGGRADAKSLVQHNLGGNPEQSLKLLQVIAFDAESHTILGKPDGFPIEACDWECTGDVCSTVALVGFKAVDNSDRACIIEYSQNVDRQALVVLAIGSSNRPVASKSTVYGDLGGECGCKVAVTFTQFIEDAGYISVMRQSTCDSACSQLCERVGLPLGKAEDRIVLLRLEE